MKNKPLVSIVTVVYNDKDSIEKTIESVIHQNFNNFEYIIIDGGSNDGTIDIINKYRSKLSFFRSEPDSGIYDAMNKALKIVKGDWINFMNSGDLFFNKNVLKEVFSKKYPKIDMIYGNVYFYNNENSFNYNSKSNKIKINLNSICHQSTFIKRDVHPAFNLHHKIAADFEIIYKFMMNGRSKYVDICICRFLIGGVSSNFKIAEREKLNIILTSKESNIFYKVIGFIFFLYGLFKSFSKEFLLKFFSPNVFYFLRNIKNKLE